MISSGSKSLYNERGADETEEQSLFNLLRPAGSALQCPEA